MKKIANYFYIFFHWRTLAAATWRALVAILDWRTHVRRITLRPILDCAFITNMRDSIDRKLFLGLWKPIYGFFRFLFVWAENGYLKSKVDEGFNGPRYWIKGTSGRTRALDVTTEDLATEEGRAKAREKFIKAVAWAEKKGARVILLAASTKRLFGEDAKELREKFPKIIFTLGDNGTNIVLEDETLRALNKSGIKSGFSRIAVIGPYGLLGEHMTKMLINKGYAVIGIGGNFEELARVKEKYNIEVFSSFAEAKKVHAVIACTHSPKSLLTTESINNLLIQGRKLLVVDVAEPSNLKYNTYKENRGRVIRQDAGNAYSPKLQYVLGPLSYKLFRLSRGVTFGCFAETLAIAHFLKKDERLCREIDWMKVDEKTMLVVRAMFASLDFGVPSPRCFGKPVNSFNLEITASPQPTLKRLANALADFIF